MTKINYTKDTHFDDENVIIENLFDCSSFSEVKISIQKNQSMSDHEIETCMSIYVVYGKVVIASNEAKIVLCKNEMVALDANESHNIEAIEDSVLRLNISKDSE